MKRLAKNMAWAAFAVASVPAIAVDAAPGKPGRPVVTKIVTTPTSKVSGSVTVWVEIPGRNRWKISKTEVRVGTQSCTMRRNATRCTVRNVRLRSRVSIRARSYAGSVPSSWSGTVSYRATTGNSWSRDDVPVGPGVASSTTVGSVATSTTTFVSTSTTTAPPVRQTTTTLPFCLANPVPAEQTVFGRAWLDSTHWNIPGVQQASKYGEYPSASLQPSRCQNFSFTGIQGRPTGSSGNWAHVTYTIVTGSTGSPYARVRDDWGINMDFRFVFEVYSGATQQWEVIYVWKSPYSCGYTCAP